MADLMENYLKTTKLKTKYKGLYTYFKCNNWMIDSSMKISKLSKELG
jgi:hypothetical protein